MSNEEMVTLIQQGHDLMGDLYQQNRRFIYKCVKPFRNTINDINDLMQTAYFGLLKAAETFNPDYDYKFLTHAKYHIVVTVRRETNKLKGIPDHVCTLIKQYKNSFDKLTTLEGKSPSEAQILAHMGISKIQLDTIKRCMAEPARLDKTLHSDTDLILADTLPDDTLPDMDELAAYEDLKQILWSAVDKLPDELKNVIVMRYKQAMSYKSIASKLGIDVEQVPLYENRALRLIRSNHKLIQRLKDYF